MKASLVSLLVFAAFLLIAVSAQPDSPYLTTEYGTPVDISTMSESVGNEGALLLQDLLLQERLARQNRERIPERTVHARGVTAFGYFISTTDMSQYTTAALFQGGGLRTDLAVRFSTVIHGQQSPEFLRDPRGFALKFYTSEGNYDIVGINFPVFFIRDGIRFPEFIRAFKPNPASGVSEWWRVLDYFQFAPESTNMLTFLLDDLGIPLSYRHINGSGVHTYVWTNSDNQGSYVRYTWVPNQGVETINSDAEAAMLDWNVHTIDLVSAINNGTYPSWELYVQILPANERYSYDFNILDTTYQWPEDQIPMQHLGTFTLDQTFQNYFLDNEQIAFAPSHFVPGISPSDEKMLQARLFSYPDAHRYRLGVNYHLLPVNAPRCPFFQTQQDGRMNTLSYQNPVNYWPSMFSNVTESPLQPNVNEDPSNFHNWEEQGFKERAVIDQIDNFAQPAQRYSSWDSDRQMRFAQRIASTLTTQGVPGTLADLWIERWTNVSAQLGSNIKSLVYSFSQTIPKEKLNQEIPNDKLHENFVQFRSDFLRASGAR